MKGNTYFVRAAWILKRAGVSRRTLRILEEEGVLKRVILPGCKYGYYKREEVIKALQMEDLRHG